MHSSHPTTEGTFSPNGDLRCSTPGCNKKLGMATRDGSTILRCQGCGTDNVFSIPLYLARSLENATAAQNKLADAVMLVANLTSAA